MRPLFGSALVDSVCNPAQAVETGENFNPTDKDLFLIQETFEGKKTLAKYL